MILTKDNYHDIQVLLNDAEIYSGAYFTDGEFAWLEIWRDGEEHKCIGVDEDVLIAPWPQPPLPE